MAEEIDVFEDDRYECFEPRENDPGFSDVLFKTSSVHDQVDLPVQAFSTITVNVGSPEKYSTFRETFIRYTVKSESSREEYKDQPYHVFRRYNDFLWLRDRLEETNPTLIIPPFPPKHSINSVDRFSGPFIINRCKALNRFINRVCAHPVLSSTDDLFHFLTVKDDQYWQDYKYGHGVNGQYWDRMKALVQNGESAPEFADAISRLDRGRYACERIINVSRQINSEEQALTREMSDLAAHYGRWSSESGHIPQVGSAFYHIGQLLEQNSQTLLPVTLCIQSDLIPELNDLIAYSECVKRVVSRRDRLQSTITNTIETADTLERGMDTPSTIARKIRRESVEAERLRREARLTELRTRTDSLSKHLSNANTDLKLELAQWENHRRHALKVNLVTLARQRLEHHKRLDQLWIRLLEDIGSVEVGNGFQAD